MTSRNASSNESGSTSGVRRSWGRKGKSLPAMMFEAPPARVDLAAECCRMQSGKGFLHRAANALRSTPRRPPPARNGMRCGLFLLLRRRYITKRRRRLAAIGRWSRMLFPAWVCQRNPQTTIQPTSDTGIAVHGSTASRPTYSKFDRRSAERENRGDGRNRQQRRPPGLRFGENDDSQPTPAARTGSSRDDVDSSRFGGSRACSSKSSAVSTSTRRSQPGSRGTSAEFPGSPEATSTSVKSTSSWADEATRHGDNPGIRAVARDAGNQRATDARRRASCGGSPFLRGFMRRQKRSGNP